MCVPLMHNLKCYYNIYIVLQHIMLHDVLQYKLSYMMCCAHAWQNVLHVCALMHNLRCFISCVCVRCIFEILHVHVWLNIKITYPCICMDAQLIYYMQACNFKACNF